MATRCILLQKDEKMKAAQGLLQPASEQVLLMTMLRVLSTHLYLNHRLHPGILDQAARAGFQGVEIFAARHHFDYTSREEISELADWFQTNPLQAWSMHAPLFPDREMGRTGTPPVNLLHPEKSRRIDSMDEVKRALETAESIHFKNLIVHLGAEADSWSPRTIEYALTALEHLGAFAHPLGVKLLVENLLSEATTPTHLALILEMGRLTNIGVCLDLGHAHMTVGIPQAFSTLKGLIEEVHLHDNHGTKDEHLWPGDGSIDWPSAVKALQTLEKPPAAVLEVSSSLLPAPDSLAARAQQTFDLLG